MADPRIERVDLASTIRAIPDFPKEGILFRDIMPMLQNPVALREAVDRLVEYGTGRHVDVVLGAEARGSSWAPRSPTASAPASPAPASLASSHTPP